MKKQHKGIRTFLIYIISLVLISLCISFLLSPTKVQSNTEEVKQEPVILAEPVVEQKDLIRDHAVVVAHTIALIETGHTLNCDMPGLSGERSCYQFLPSTWTSYSKQVYGYTATQTPERAKFVAEEMIYRMLKQGYSDRQIFLIWNSGRPNGCSKGVNSHGVKYDSCAYVQMAMATLKVTNID